ncbi:hypothetical protein PILCRDRAFT_824158 [Piloderma croceum F 1598]|uniref:Aminoglycoside phosphotransferase domain-containing protein n=1 Tax=Piloderma croceum (strain F 1598) TaxID=765440 RepID=A0A0C3BN47_PILCF|nr:hypothetical protein PILCRDRAFT_824158 [Piloderma croceum F 1598]
MTDKLNDTLTRFASLSDLERTSTKVSSLDAWTDDELEERIKTASPLPDAIYTLYTTFSGGTGPMIIGHNVYDLCRDTVVKKGVDCYLAPEARALDFVRAHTSIPVPKVRRYIVSGYHANLLMEKIEGTRLDKLWPSYSPLQRFLTAWILRGYILELRKASSLYHRFHVPGPMANDPQQCHGPAFLFGDDYQGPFEHSRQLFDYFSKRPGNSGLRFDNSYDSQPLVLTHNDLSMRNIIVDRDGKLWLVDWEWSGFYPPFCEYIATKNAAFNDRAPRSWCNYIPLITGIWLNEERMVARAFPCHLGYSHAI